MQSSALSNSMAKSRRPIPKTSLFLGRKGVDRISSSFDHRTQYAETAPSPNQTSDRGTHRRKDTTPPSAAKPTSQFFLSSYIHQASSPTTRCVTFASFTTNRFYMISSTTLCAQCLQDNTTVCVGFAIEVCSKAQTTKRIREA